MNEESVVTPQSVPEVEQLVKRLYQPGTPQLIASIQDQLQRLQRSGEGWQLADALLSSDDVNVRFFGALTFTVKLNNDGSSLDAETARTVLQRLVSWLVRLVNQKDGRLVIRKLCSTLVTYFLRSSIKWPRPLFHILCSFRQGDALSMEAIEGAKISTDELVPSLSELQLTTLLWFSASLADEVGKLEHFGPAQAGFHVQMETEILDASTIMSYSLSNKTHGSTKFQNEALHCFQAWTNYAQPMWPNRVDLLQQVRTLIEPALRCLLEDETEQDALDIFIDLLESYTSFFQPPHQEAILHVIESRFGPQLELSLEEYGAMYVPAGQFLISYCVAVVEYIVEKPDSNRARICIRLLGMILKASGYPGDDDDLSTLSIEFWNTYIEYINDTLFSQDQDDPEPPWLTHAKTVSFELTSLLWKKLWTPPGEVTINWGDSEKEGFRAFRTDTADLLVSIFTFLGGEMLQQLVQLSLQSLEQQEWRAVEASMFCLNALSDNVLEDTTSDDILAPLFGSTIFRDVADFTEEIPSQVRRTAIDTLGNYGSYIERHPEFLPDAVRFLFASLENASLASIAAKSIASLCSTCRHNLTTELDGFLAQYRQFASSPTTDAYTKEKVISGVAAIIQALNPESAKAQPLAVLLENVEKDINLAKDNMAFGNVEQAEAVGVCALECLASIGKALQVPDELPLALYDEEGSGSDKTNFWSTDEGKSIQQRVTGCFSVLQLLSGSGAAIDAACQVLRSGLTEVAPGPFVLPSSVTVDFLEQCSVGTPQLESVLSTACMLIAHHSRTNTSRMIEEVRSLYWQITRFIQALGRPTQDPGIAQGCIDLLIRLLPTFAGVFFDSSSEQLEIVLRFTIQAIEGPDPLPKRSALEFWTKLVKGAGPPSPSMRLTPDLMAKAFEVMASFGPSLTQALIFQIAGLGQRSDLDYLCDPLRALFASLPTQAKAWAETALMSSAFPPVASNVGLAEKRKLLLQLTSLRGGANTKMVVKEFFVTCRGVVASY